MKHWIFVLSLVLSFEARASAQDCERRMSFNVVGIVERALFRQVISVKQAKALALAERPFNPLKNTVPTPETANYIAAFEGIAAMSPEQWLPERGKLQVVVMKAEERTEVESVASENTAAVLGLVAEMGKNYSGYVSTGDGDIYYSVIEGKRLTVKRLFDEKPVWRDNKDIDERSFASIRANPVTGAPEMLYYRFHSTPWRLFGRNKVHYQVWLVDLVTGQTTASTADVDSSDAVFAVADWAREKRTSDWVVGYTGPVAYPTGVSGYDPAREEASRFSIVYNEETEITNFAFVPNVLNGQNFVAVVRLASPAGARETLVEVYRAGESKPVFTEHLPFYRYNDLFLFERQGDLYLVVDQLEGMTRVYRPLTLKNPVAEADLSSFRTMGFQYLKGRNQTLYMVGSGKGGKRTFILSPFARLR